MPMLNCAALALVLANPASSGSFTLAEDCGPGGAAGRPALRVTAQFEQPVVVEAAGRRVHGLWVQGGGNLTWRGGEIVSPGGTPQRNSRGPGFYAVWLNGARGVTLDKVRVTAARKAIVVSGSGNITVSGSRCDGVVEDCMIVSDSRTIRFVDNEVTDLTLMPSLCRRPAGTDEGLSRQQCTAAGGQWEDGWHSDVLQLRDAVSDVVASGNRIATIGHGLTQMDSATDRPLADVHFENNVIASGRHGLTLANCADCRISGNQLTSAVPGWKSIIRPGRALACGNNVPDGGEGRAACP